jgi:hypothetical protein
MLTALSLPGKTFTDDFDTLGDHEQYVTQPPFARARVSKLKPSL